MPKAFLQCLYTLLTAVITAQLVLSPVAMAAQGIGQAGQPSFNNDPFWSDKQGPGGQIDPNDPNFWFNNNGGNLTGANSDDPWGNWDDPNGNTSPFNTGSFGDPSSDPWGVFGGWNPGSFDQSKATDSISLKFLKMTGVISKDYATQIHEYRTKYSAYGTEDDNAIADIIIEQHARTAGLLGAGIAVLPTGLSKLMSGIFSNAGGIGNFFGYGVSTLGGMLVDYMAIIAQETSMMYELQSLYGELSDDADDRAASAIMPFTLGVVGGSLNKAVAHALHVVTSDPPPVPPVNPVVPVPGPAPIPPAPAPFDPFVPVPGPAAATATDKVVAAAVSDANKIMVNPLTGEVAKAWNVRMANWFITKSHLVQFIMKMLPASTQFKEKIANTIVAKMPVVMKVGASAAALSMAAGFSYWSNHKSCELFGQWAKRYYQSLHQVQLARVIAQLRSNNEAKAVVWLVLLKDVFQSSSMTPEDAKVYAAIMSREMPLVNNGKWDELASMQHDYTSPPDLALAQQTQLAQQSSQQANGQAQGLQMPNVNPVLPNVQGPQMLDNLLKYLRNTLSTEAKLYMVKLVLGGMLMKGGVNYHDHNVIQNLAISLGLYPPDKSADVSTFKTNDPRIADRDRYLELIDRLKMEVTEEGKASQSKQLAKDNSCGAKAAHWGRSGQIIVCDFANSDVSGTADILARVQANGGLDGRTSQQLNNCANSIAQHSDGKSDNSLGSNNGCKVDPSVKPASTTPIVPPSFDPFSEPGGPAPATASATQQVPATPPAAAPGQSAVSGQGGGSQSSAQPAVVTVVPVAKTAQQ